MRDRHLVLIVDDAEINRSILSDILAEDYDILEASDGLEAMAILQRRHSDISLVLLDLVMPKMDGFEVLAAMNKAGWIGDTPVITISAESAPGIIDQTYDLGASDYINRPFDEKTVRRRVRNTIMLYAKQRMLEDIVTEQVMEKEKNNLVMVEILSNIVEFRNGESGLHVMHIRLITEILLRKLTELTDQYLFTPSQLAVLVNASALHDIGKISIPEEILNKPGKLTPEEFAVMKTHSAIGAQILEETPYHSDNELVKAAHDICRWHHERWDGRGYPDGLKGDQIPIGAQVVALADVYDALTSVRVYKPAFSHEKAMEMILGGECGAFNPFLLRCLTAVGPHLQKEMEVRSGQSGEEQTRQLAAQLIAGGKASSRTLALLEQERVKYQFFAAMSNEIQFEMDFKTDILTLSDGGAVLLDLNTLIVHPKNDGALNKVFMEQDYLDLCARLHRAKPDRPIINGTYRLQVRGEFRWHKMVARPLWGDGEESDATGAIGKFIDIHEDYLHMERLKRLAEQDGLTGLLNQRSSKEAIESIFLQSQGQRAVLMFLDIDNFKVANERFGHLFGDQILQHIARMIQKNIRSGDVAARSGGDEFLIFMPCKSEPEALVERLFRAVSCRYEGFQLSVSMGVAFAPDNGENYKTLFAAADRALYTAKQQGKSRYCLYNDSMEGAQSVLSPKDH